MNSRGKFLIVFLAVLIVIIVLVSSLAVYWNLSTRYEKRDVSNPSSDDRIENFSDFSVDSRHITYLLNEIGAYRLHAPPFSSDRPKIQTVSDNKIFFSVVKKGGSIETTEGDQEDEDLIIIISGQEVYDSLISSNTTEFIQNSVIEGRTGIEIMAGETEMFGKGYLGLYKELTGQDFGDLISGAVIWWRD
ncbi:MAG: hypothetical protein ABIH72_04040 [archaeon]